jgi:hypothetical protein
MFKYMDLLRLNIKNKTKDKFSEITKEACYLLCKNMFCYKAVDIIIISSDL